MASASVLTSLHSRLDQECVSPLCSRSCFSSWYLITAIETLTKTVPIYSLPLVISEKHTRNVLNKSGTETVMSITQVSQMRGNSTVPVTYLQSTAIYTHRSDILTFFCFSDCLCFLNSPQYFAAVLLRIKIYFLLSCSLGLGKVT